MIPKAMKLSARKSEENVSKNLTKKKKTVYDFMSQYSTCIGTDTIGTHPRRKRNDLGNNHRQWFRCRVFGEENIPAFFSQGEH